MMILTIHQTLAPSYCVNVHISARGVAGRTIELYTYLVWLPLDCGIQGVGQVIPNSGYE